MYKLIPEMGADGQGKFGEGDERWENGAIYCGSGLARESAVSVGEDVV
jgi:hypothetical protein